jgi:5-methylcytosine-specific restriction protein A
MPTSLPRACRPGCPHPAQSCPEHSVKAKAKFYDDRRGSAASRGYGSRWREYRTWYLAELIRQEVPRAGLCGSRLPGTPATFDSKCAEQGLIVMGAVVDHITPVYGPNDPTFYAPTAHQLLCDPCHQAKRQREARGAHVANVSVHGAQQQR